MKIKVNNCVDCGKPCMLFCPLRDNSYEYRCDECGAEINSGELYIGDLTGQELCIDCIKKTLRKAYP